MCWNYDFCRNDNYFWHHIFFRYYFFRYFRNWILPHRGTNHDVSWLLSCKRVGTTIFAAMRIIFDTTFFQIFQKLNLATQRYEPRSFMIVEFHLPLTTYHLPLTTYHLPLTTYHLPLCYSAILFDNFKSYSFAFFWT